MKTPEMKHQKYSLWIWLSIFLVGIACEKPSTVEALAPPQPHTEDTAIVSASFPGYTLLSRTNSRRESLGTESYFRDYGTIQWKCLSKPNQAPPPNIASPNTASSAVSQLQKGEYLFEVTYSTKAGSKQAQTRVLVVEDGLANGPVVLPSQVWQKKDWSVWPDMHHWASEIDIENRPDLFCYKQGKKLRVEIQDLIKNEWREIEEYEYDNSISRSLHNPYFYVSQSSRLNVFYDHMVDQDSVMERIVTQKAAIRLSIRNP